MSTILNAGIIAISVLIGDYEFNNGLITATLLDGLSRFIV